MEENVQRVFSIMVAVIVFFLLPMYVAFEKKDDIAYALAVRITSELVENVKNNGYISKKMYDEYVSKMAVTGNTYEINFEHKSYKYNPVICSYSDATYTKLLETFEYDIYKDQYLSTGIISYNGATYGNLVLSYSRSEEVYTENQILDVFATENNIVYTGMNKTDYVNVGVNSIPLNPNLYASGTLGPVYTMNKGDSFTVRVKNTNTTVAEIFFNALTLGMTAKPVPRVYVNYGCTIQSEKYKNWVLANSGYTGSVQEITIAETGKYLLEVWGASGAGNDPSSTVLGSRGGKGGYSKGEIQLTKGTKLYAYVGGKGTGSSGGFNGGGDGGPAANGGGGATDIRLVGGVWNDTISLASRLIVAGGGGGSDDTLVNEVAGGGNDGSGGAGGGTNGGRGYIDGINSATQTFLNNASPAVYVNCAMGGNQYGGSGLQFGYAMPASLPTDVGGGGGGYYGGAPSLHYNGGGGGGSGYIGGVTSGEMQSGVNTGNGSFRITFIN